MPNLIIYVLLCFIHYKLFFPNFFFMNSPTKKILNVKYKKNIFSLSKEELWNCKHEEYTKEFCDRKGKFLFMDQNNV